MSSQVDAALEAAFRDDWGRIVATLIRVTGDWDLAEECAQDAFVSALRSWPSEGIPARPGAWLTTTAHHRALDRLRRAAVGSAKLREIAALDRTTAGREQQPPEPADDRLGLIFTCCHPALPMPARVALTLRTLGGLTVEEIARAFLVPEATMAKRLTRAKQKIRHAGIPFRVPPPPLRAERTAGVLAVLYLQFNQGYRADADDRAERLCAEAIRLAGLLAASMPDQPETAGLLALLLFQHSRRHARLDAAGDLVTLDQQDRTRWDRDEISRAQRVLDRALRHGRVGPYQLQAAIAAQHAVAATAPDTGWPEIVRLYRLLASVSPSPVVELNLAVAVAMADGPQAGLDLLDPLEAGGALDGYYLLPATRADLLRRLGRHDDAAESYRAALDLAPSDAERRFLTRRLEVAKGGT